MPTPVAAARQCLTQESAAVLEEAVAVARRRAHAQTTSLHMVSSLLSLPNSSLREACSRTRSSAYSTRVQFKALELSLTVSLDRLPSSQAAKVDEPPVSNSLMAAIKRSQANQRRQPENFSFYQQQYASSPSSAPLVRVELQNLIVSILDDPLVSRVFAEAGFRSCDIKMATLRPGNSFHPSQLLGYTSRYKRPNPPLFLCSDVVAASSKGFNFPFMGCFSGDDNTRRIGEVMLRDKKKCPLLLGISATDALASFLETVQMKASGGGALPDGLSGLCVECVKDEILRYLSDDCDEAALRLRFEELERAAESGGVVVDFGDLGALVGDDVAADKLKFLVGNLGRLVDLYNGKLWLIGMAATYEVYFKILNRFPSIEEDWQLGVLPVTSKFSMGGSYPRSSLMESFVPLGGFFSMPSETKSPLSNSCQYVSRCHLCNEKYELEVASVSNAEKHQSGSPSSIKGTDDRMLLNAKIMAIQKKWDSICHQNHLSQAYSHQVPRVLGFQVRKGKTNEYSENISKESSREQGNKIASPSLSTHLEKSSTLKESSSWELHSKDNNSSVVSKSGEIPPDLISPNLDSSTASLDDDRTSPTSVTSVTTDLGLAIISSEKVVDHVEAFAPNISNWDSGGHSDIAKDPKLLYRALLERVGDHQEEALSSIVETLTRRNTKPSDEGIRRGNIWINVRGADTLGKKKLGLALAEILYTSKENLIYVDLSFQEEITHADALFNSQITNKYDLTMRGTVIDYLVEKLSKKPSVFFLDNIDKADLVVQNTLFQALKSGRFTDWCGREVSVNKCIFLGATRLLEGNKSSSCGDEEEDVLRAKGSSMQIVIRFDLSDDPTSENSMNKRKLLSPFHGRRNGECESHEMARRAHKVSRSNSYLDLNLPADQGSEVCNAISVESDSASSSENSGSWLEDFDREVDQMVMFKNFDFVRLGDKVFKSMAECLHNAVGCECSVEVEPKVMQQIVAAAYLYGIRVVENWIEEVVREGFVEAMGKYSLSARSIVRVEAVGEEQRQGLLPTRITMK